MSLEGVLNVHSLLNSLASWLCIERVSYYEFDESIHIKLLQFEVIVQNCKKRTLVVALEEPILLFFI
jgi:hypothetical protein